MTAPVVVDEGPDWCWVYARLRYLGLTSSEIADLTDVEIFGQYLWADVDEAGRPKPRSRSAASLPAIAEPVPQTDEERYTLLMKSGRELKVPEEKLREAWAAYLAKKGKPDGG